jgi:hypothetical protein
MAHDNKRDQRWKTVRWRKVKRPVNQKSERWRRRRDFESRKADCGVRAGVLIEDDQQFQNGRTRPNCHGRDSDPCFTGEKNCGNTVKADRCYGGKLVGKGIKKKKVAKCRKS